MEWSHIGMICAEDELGIGQSHDGIMVLEPEARVGIVCPGDYLHLGSDTVFSIGLTPNRVGRCLSHRSRQGFIGISEA